MLIGTAGHIDHGKTTLVKAITGVDADRLPEEKARGITLDLGYAYAPLPGGGTLGFVDVPGHERLVRTMLAGATGIDCALLVVAADDGPMPQTREHLELLDLLGISSGAVALTRIDIVTPDRLAAARDEVEALMAGSALACSPVFPLSGRTGEGVPALRMHLETMASALPARPSAGRFRLAIDRCFTLAGIGTVVTGTVHSGKVSVGETVVLSPPELRARVRSLHAQGVPAPQALAGDRCALALAGDFERRDVTRGMWAVDPALATPIARFHGELRVPAAQAPLRHLQPVHVHLGTADIPGRVALLDCAEVGPGGTALAEILLDCETVAAHGDRFILRDAGARRNVAGGRVLDIHPPVRRKRAPAHLALLATLRSDDPADALALLAARDAGVDLDRFAANWNLAEAAAEALWARAGMRVIRDVRSSQGFAAPAWATLGGKLLDALTREHERVPDLAGVGRERLRCMTAPGLPRHAFDALCDEQLAAGRIAQTRAWLHLPEHRAVISAADRELFAALKPLLDAAPFNPPRVRDVSRADGMAEEAVRRLFGRLARAGALYPVAHDHYFTAAAVADLAGVVRRLGEENGTTHAAALRNAIFPAGDGGRKVAIHILEFFDRVGYTRRVRDGHVLRREGADGQWMAA